MIGIATRKLLIAGVVAGGFLATPSESYAIFGWLSRCCAPRATYMPVAPAPTCCPAPVCPPQQTCNYVPVTAFRNQVCNVPVTTCRPVTTCDPCTGCPTTTYRPVTTIVQQVQRIPYTTYRLSCSTNTCASPCSTNTCASPCATGGCSSGSCGSTVAAFQSPAAVGAPSSSCSSCSSSTTYTTPAAPVAPAYTAPPANSYPQPTSPMQPAPQTYPSPSNPASQQPSLSPLPASSNPTPQTFENSSASESMLQRPIQDLNTGSQAPSYPNPQLIEPNSRSTALPVRTVQASYQTTSSILTDMAPAVPVRLPAAYQTVSSEGWRSSSR